MADSNNDIIDISTDEDRHYEFQRVYIKDLSFEVPFSPDIFTQNIGIPKIKHHIQSMGKRVDGDLYEVSIVLTVNAKTRKEDKIIYLAEVVQAGLFILKGYDNKERRYMIGSYCPNALYPYAREVVSNMIQHGGFPHMMLPPLNFDAMYEVYLQQLEQQENDKKAEDA